MKLNAVPMPKHIDKREGYLCIVPCYTLDDTSFLPSVAAASELYDRIWGLALRPLDAVVPDESLFTPLTEASESSATPADPKPEKRCPMALPGEERCDTGFFIIRDNTLREGEYKIDVASACRIEASDAEGLFRAFSLIAQIAGRTCDKYIKIPKCSISDVPDSPFRGLLLDVARRWHPIDYLYRYVDLCSLIGINRFIIHFTDDESYTLPSDLFPKLPSDGRHYTKNELRALDEYASARGVMIIPEIDMPGHSAQFSLKYPDIFGKCGIMEATDKVFDALFSLYSEASSLFPNSKYIHAGGDEAILGRWDDSEKTKAYMKQNGIPDFVTLYGRFVGKVCDEILSLGKTPIVWEGFGKNADDEVSKDVLVISWENHYQTAGELVSAGFRILNASWRPLYCVSPWQKWSPEEILSFNKYMWDHWWETSKAYDKGVSVSKDSPVDGGMLCAWGDYLKNYESSRLACQLEFASVKPRISALAEILWNDSSADFKTFSAAFEKVSELLDRMHGESPFRGRL